MADFLDSLNDFKHVVLAAGAIWLYFKWQKVRQETRDQLEKEREDHKTLVKDVIYTTLNNGLSEKMRVLIQDHEVREKQNMNEVIAHHTDMYHRNKK